MRSCRSEWEWGESFLLHFPLSCGLKVLTCIADLCWHLICVQSVGIRLDGRKVYIVSAVSRDDAGKFKDKKLKTHKGIRNLYLSREGCEYSQSPNTLFVKKTKEIWQQMCFIIHSNSSWIERCRRGFRIRHGQEDKGKQWCIFLWVWKMDYIS